MNKCILTGNVCKEVEYTMTNDNKQIVRNTIAVRRDFKNRNNEYDSDFINIVLYEPHSKFFSQYVHKGDKIALCGRWTNNNWTDQNNKHYDHVLVVDNVEPLAKPQQKPEQTYVPESNPFANVPDDELPF